jgi:hypothetical protein
MKLFNKHRFKMVEAKRLKNYLVYAIGEIILVVIGILIAVSINNQNEAKNDEAQVAKIALQVKKKITLDLANMKTISKTLNEDLKLYNLYLKPEKTEKEQRYINAQAPFLVTLYVEFLSFNPIISPSLNQATLDNNKLSTKLLEIQHDYTAINESLKPMEEIIKDELISNITYIKEHFDWYEKLVSNQPSFTNNELEYFKSQDYKNRVVHMKFIYIDAYKDIIKDFETVLTERLQELNQLTL